MQVFLASLMFLFVFSANAQTLEERVTKIERKLEYFGPRGHSKAIYYTKGTMYYVANGDCSKVKPVSSWVFNTTLKYVREIKCDKETYIVGSFTIPEGYQRTGELVIQAYNKNDVMVEE